MARRFESTELEPLSVKGKSEPVQAVVLGELCAEAETSPRAADGVRTSFRSSTASGSAPSSAASVAPVRMGYGTLVELVGEPGIGKSRLAQELRENCADMRQIDLRCEQVRGVDALLPVPPVPPLAARRRR